MRTAHEQAAYLAGVRAGLAAATRTCMLVELELRRRGDHDAGHAARQCALTVAEVKPGDVSEPDRVPLWGKS